MSFSVGVMSGMSIKLDGGGDTFVMIREEPYGIGNVIETEHFGERIIAYLLHGRLSVITGTKLGAKSMHLNNVPDGATVIYDSEVKKGDDRKNV